ncbi:MAG: metallophosphoesterase [Planctomycetota bacterium]
MLDPQNLSLPRLPEPLAGLRIAHLTDPHVSTSEADGLRPRFRRMLAELGAEHRRRPIDLLVFTGDYMSQEGEESAGLRFLREACAAVPLAHRTFGVFGNHDSDELIDTCLREGSEAPPVSWLPDRAVGLSLRGTTIRLLGLHTSIARWPDAVRLARNLGSSSTSHRDDPDPPFTLMLCHFPRVLPTAADLGVDLVLSGHTHGGQICLPGRKPIKNSSSLPNRLTAGRQRHRDTLLCVSRGLGEMTLPFRVFAPRQLPIYTLTPGPLPPLDETRPTHARTELVQRW